MKDIDWNRAWQEARSRNKEKRDRRAYWNKRAPAFARHAGESPYAGAFLRLLHLRPDWTVLDVGCGAGTLALPLALLVKEVTAIDLSDAMISLLRDQCREQGISNIRTEVLGWEDDWDRAGIGGHDVAIASRSLVPDDLRAALTKLDQRARRAVYISSPVGDGPFDRRIFEAAGRELDRRPDYIYVYNVLYQMGIQAEIRFMDNREIPKVYSGIDEAMESGLLVVWCGFDVYRYQIHTKRQEEL